MCLLNSKYSLAFENPKTNKYDTVVTMARLVICRQEIRDKKNLDKE